MRKLNISRKVIEELRVEALSSVGDLTRCSEEIALDEVGGLPFLTPASVALYCCSPILTRFCSIHTVQQLLSYIPIEKRNGPFSLRC